MTRARQALAAGVAGAALLTVASPFAATGIRDAKSLALRKADFPASAVRMSEKENRSAPLPGGTGQAYTTTFQFKVGPRTIAVGALVITAPGVAVARRVFGAAVADSRRTAAAPLRLPRLGNQQYAALYGRPALAESSAAVWVRSDTVVWQVQTSSVRNPFGFTKAEAIAALSQFARRQQRRVRHG